MYAYVYVRGLRNMTSEQREVRAILRVLALRVTRSQAEMSGQNLGNAFYSLHAMSNRDGEGNEVPEVTGVYKVITCIHTLLYLHGSIYSIVLSMDTFNVYIFINTLYMRSYTHYMYTH